MREFYLALLVLGALTIGALAFRTIGRLGVLGKLGSYCFMGAGGATLALSIVLRTLERGTQIGPVQDSVVTTSTLTPAPTPAPGPEVPRVVQTPEPAPAPQGPTFADKVREQHKAWDGKKLFLLTYQGYLHSRDTRNLGFYFDPNVAFPDKTQDKVSPEAFEALAQRIEAIKSKIPMQKATGKYEINLGWGRGDYRFKDVFVHDLMDRLKQRFTGQIEFEHDITQWVGYIYDEGTNELPTTFAIPEG